MRNHGGVRFLPAPRVGWSFFARPEERGTLAGVYVGKERESLVVRAPRTEWHTHIRHPNETQASVRFVHSLSLSFTISIDFVVVGEVNSTPQHLFRFSKKWPLLGDNEEDATFFLLLKEWMFIPLSISINCYRTTFILIFFICVTCDASSGHIFLIHLK